MAKMLYNIKLLYNVLITGYIAFFLDIAHYITSYITCDITV